ncbi:aegerolysin family protein [Kitasatospora sp. NPDC051914]|uniref:aegerolysin family protein n=1 Tax=Kitasatospora sp. NPDC051914 TaxID=3154945 RepID=UPI00341CBFAB
MGAARRIGTAAIALAVAGALSVGVAGTASAVEPTKAAEPAKAAEGAKGGQPAAAPALTSAARSVSVKFNNWTGCTLTREEWGLNHGIWAQEPPVRIYDQGQGSWASESNGFATGTEGWARFFSENCADPVLNGRLLRVHWNNPYVGSNSYDSTGTDLKFYVSKSGGSGNNASVQFSAWGR